MPVLCELPLRGAGGEPISFARTVYSHGLAQLPPARVDHAPLVYNRRLRVGGSIVDVAISESGGMLVARTASRLRRRDAIVAQDAIVRMFRLSDDLAPFYAAIGDGDALTWATRGAGRFRQPDRLRRRRQDHLHHELRVVGDDSHDRCARRAGRGVVSRARAARRHAGRVVS